MASLIRLSLIALAFATPFAALVPAGAQPSAADWSALAELPDFSGVWVPDVADQRRKERNERPPWTTAAQQQIDFLFAEDRAGRPKLILDHCLPHGMPSWMLITHNALEILATPGRITMLGEGDGNRIRRIYLDGRPHPLDPDLTIHGHSTAKWDGDTLVVDTVGIIPQSYIALSEAVGIPNNGGMHVVERIRLQDADTLIVELAITAPKVLTDTWTTTRLFVRRRGPSFDIVEGQCVQGALVEAEDEHGNAVFEHAPRPRTAACRRAAPNESLDRHRNHGLARARGRRASLNQHVRQGGARHDRGRGRRVPLGQSAFESQSGRHGRRFAQGVVDRDVEPGVLTRSGWTKRTFNPGDKIKLKFGPLRNGDAGGYFLEATLADGKVMTYSVELATE